MLLMTEVAFGQFAIIEFEKTRHDFGVIREDGGLAEYEFKFTNKGILPLVITNVQVTCGCTTPQWSREAIAPGRSGTIKAAFNPYNRPGVFDKTLTVTANTQPSATQLRIHGIVEPKLKIKQSEFLDTIGNLRLQSRYLNFGNITTKEPVVKEYKLLNEGEEPMELSISSKTPQHLKVMVEPEIIDPKKIGLLKVTFFPRLKNDFGNTSDVFILTTNDSKFPKKAFTVLAHITEYFPDVTPETLEEAPRIRLETSSKDFGKIIPGTSTTMEFEFTNVGKKDLIIRKLKASCLSNDQKEKDIKSTYLQDPKCLPGNATKTTLKPGETGRIKASLTTSGKSGMISKTVNIYCNDPANPNPSIFLKAEITEN